MVVNSNNMTLQEKYEYLFRLLKNAPDTFKFHLVRDMLLCNKRSLQYRLCIAIIKPPTREGFEWMNSLYKELKQIS